MLAAVKGENELFQLSTSKERPAYTSDIHAFGAPMVIIFMFSALTLIERGHEAVVAGGGLFRAHALTPGI